jgi:putative DNA primase/helicase
MTATASSPAQFPGDAVRRDPVPCAVLSLEEPADRLVARLHGASADLDNVIVMGDVQDIDEDGEPVRRPWSLPGDCGILEDLITEQAIGLLTVDGLGYSIKGDSHNYANVGAALSSLAGVAERTGCAIVGLVHPPKGGSDPVTAAIGSTAWTAIPRVCWVLGADPEDESGATRVVRVSKTNYREPDHVFALTIVSDERFDCGVVAGMARSDVTAEDLVAASSTGEEKTERAEAREFVRSALASGPMDTDALLKMTRAAGLSDRTVKRARSDLKVIASQRQDPTTGCVVGWELRLPDGTFDPQDHPERLWPPWPCGHCGCEQRTRGPSQANPWPTGMHRRQTTPCSWGRPVSAGRPFRRSVERGRTLVLSGPIRDDASPIEKERAARRRIVATTGRCPCGAVLHMPDDLKPGSVTVVAVEHGDGCPAVEADR